MTVAASSRPLSPFSVFRNRTFTLMWTGQLVSTAGSALTSLAAGILVYRLTGSALSVGLMMMATAVPTLFVGLIAGVFVDRYDRRNIMIAADLIRGALVLLIPFLIPTNIAWLYILVALASAVGQFFDPAYASVLPEIASDEELAAANSMVTISSIGAQAIGFAAAGFIASRLDITWAFYIDAISFVFSAACVLLIRVAPLKVEGETNIPAIMRNLRTGAKIIVDTPSLRSLFLIYVPVFVIYGLNNALLLPFARRALHATEFEYGLIEGVTTVGFVLGSFAMASLADRLREGQWIAISFIGMAMTGIVYSLLSSVPLAIMVGTLAAFLNSPSVIGRQLLIQRNTPREARGRVSSAFFVTRDTMFLLGMASAGLADVVDVRVLFFGNAVVFLIVGSLALILPGLGQPAAEWRRAIRLLRGAEVAPGLGMGRAATLADFDLLATRLPALSGLSRDLRQNLAAQTLVADAPGGTIVVRKGEASDAAYFILNGRAVAGYAEPGSYRLLEVLNPGDFFGEIAALTGVPRTANVITEEPSTLLQVPAPALRQMMGEPHLNRLFLSKMTERMARMNMLDMPRVAGLDQQALQELRTPGAEAAA
ncbi:MAG: Cyclic nucleotide-binding protein [Anaerolineales bacterium]|nr:Cyclic nucleotide-binding protein [Anaerolineales bacterium]